MMKRLLSLLMVLCLLLTILPVTVSAAGNLAGRLGNNLSYYFNASTGELRITGSGEMISWHISGVSYGTYWKSHAPDLVLSDVKTLVIGEGVTSIANEAFKSFINLESVTLPDSLTTIGIQAFYRCINLKSINLPDALTVIGDSAFYQCYALTSLTLPESLTSLGRCAFMDTGIVEIVIPKGITTVATGLFASCENLTSVTFRSPIVNVGNSAFDSCPQLTSVTFEGGVSGKIGEEAFAYCNLLVDCVLNEGVTRICDSAFGGCTSLPNLVIPESVQYIDSFAFYDCDQFTAITIPDGVISIDIDAFRSCSGLKEFTIYSDTQIVGSGYLVSGRQLDFVHVIGDAPEDWPEGVFGAKGEQFVVYYDRGTSGWEPFLWNGYIIEVWGEPESIKSGICGENVTWTLENGVLTISGTGPMYQYGQGQSPWYPIKHKVKTLIIEDGITEITDDAFYSLHRMTEVTIPDSVTRLGHHCFGRCQSLTELTIPASVTKVGGGIICDEYYIETVTFLGDAPEFGSDPFYSASVTAYYPMGNETWTDEILDKYDSTTVWVPYCPEHVYVKETVEANCIRDGGTTYTCSICQDTYTEDFRYATGQHTYADDQDTTCDICGNVRDLTMPTTPMYRLYNPNSGEHFYTGSVEERENLINAGWVYEGIAWNAPTNTGAPVYRLYNPNNSDHHYTMSADERDNLVVVGWIYEGVAWNSAPADHPDALPLYRLYNPNADCGSHHYTGSIEERDNLVALGWHYEGIGWFGMLK